MRKIIGVVTCGLVLIAVAFYAKEKEVKEVLAASTIFRLKAEAPVKAVGSLLAAEATVEVEAIEELEADFLKKSDKEIEAAIVENEAFAKKKNFIALANTNQLDQKTTAEFVKYIRLNGALHKILMERKLEALELESI